VLREKVTLEQRRGGLSAERLDDRSAKHAVESLFIGEADACEASLLTEAARSELLGQLEEDLVRRVLVDHARVPRCESRSTQRLRNAEHWHGLARWAAEIERAHAIPVIAGGTGGPHGVHADGCSIASAQALQVAAGHLSGP